MEFSIGHLTNPVQPEKAVVEVPLVARVGCTSGDALQAATTIHFEVLDDGKPWSHAQLAHNQLQRVFDAQRCSDPNYREVFETTLTIRLAR